MKTARHNGFTLVEMMMALVVLAVLLAVGAPAFSDLIKNNRMLSHVYAMRSALNTARSEALALRTFVTLCRSDDGLTCSGDWNEGFIAFIDADTDGAVDDPNEPLLVSNVGDVGTLNITYVNGSDPTDPVANRIRFDSRGYATNFGGTFTICDDRGVSDARGLIVSPGGMIRALDPNGPVACP